MFSLKDNGEYTNVLGHLEGRCPLPNGDVFISTPSKYGIRRWCINEYTGETQLQWIICVDNSAPEEIQEENEKEFVQYLAANNIVDDL